MKNNSNRFVEFCKNFWIAYTYETILHLQYKMIEFWSFAWKSVFLIYVTNVRGSVLTQWKSLSLSAIGHSSLPWFASVWRLLTCGLLTEIELEICVISLRIKKLTLFCSCSWGITNFLINYAYAYCFCISMFSASDRLMLHVITQRKGRTNIKFFNIHKMINNDNTENIMCKKFSLKL